MRLLRTGAAVAKPVIRGLTSQRVLVVRDGVRQEGQGWGDEHGPEIGEADVDRIEVVRGPSSLLYGSDALGGVVQTVQRDLFADARSAELRLSATSATQQTDASLRVGAVRPAALGLEGPRRRPARRPRPHARRPRRQHGAERHDGLGPRGPARRRARAASRPRAGTFRQQIGLFEPDCPQRRVRAASPSAARSSASRTTAACSASTCPARASLQRIEADRGRPAEPPPRVRRSGRRPEPLPAPDDGDGRRAGAPPARRARLRHARRVGLHQRNETLAEETLIPGGTTVNGAVFAAEQLVLPTLTLDAGARLDARRLSVEDTPALGVAAQTRTYTALTGAVGAAWQPRTDRLARGQPRPRLPRARPAGAVRQRRPRGHAALRARRRRRCAPRRACRSTSSGATSRRTSTPSSARSRRASRATSRRARRARPTPRAASRSTTSRRLRPR